MEFTADLPIIFIYLGLCLLLFLGPLFYLYCRALLNKEQKIIRQDLLHFVPGFAFMFLAVVFQNIGFKNLPVVMTAILFFIFYFHFVAYLVLIKIRFLSAGSTSLTNPTKKWLNILFYGLLAIWVVYVLNLFEEGIPYIIGPIIYSITVYTITYLAYKKKYLQVINTVKYQAVPFSDAEIHSLYLQVEDLVQKERLYLEPDVSLSSLARKLKTSSQKVSLSINSRSNYNFNEYVNRYRVDYAKQLLSKPESRNLTIAAIGVDSGFNSLSSFNQAFKKITSLTPSSYRNLHASGKE